MKKNLFTLAAALITFTSAFSQNTNPWPATGNVGIGTNSPATVLEVVGGTSATVTNLLQLRSISSNTGTGTGIRFVNSTNSGNASTGGELRFVRNTQGSSFVLSTAYSGSFNDRFTINEDGNVGLGSLNPTSTIDVHRAPATSADIPKLNLMSYVEGASGNSARITLGKSRGTTIGTYAVTSIGDMLGTVDFAGVNSSSAIISGTQIRSYQDGIPGTSFIPGRLVFYTATDAATVTERMTIKSNGNIGIGTVNPSGILHVVGPTSTSGAGVDIGLYAGKGAASSNGGNIYLATGANGSGGSSGSIIFARSSTAGSAGSESMRINPAGNLGIGTASPDEKLQVAGGGIKISNLGSTGLKLYNSADNSEKMHLYWRTADNVIEMNTGTGSGRQMSFVTNGIEGIRVNAAGNVGLGTTVPDEKLTVNGKIHAREVRVDLNIPGPDYVFEPDYKLASLDELKAYVDKNHHLPEIPSAAQMEKDGINLSDMNMKLLKKVEELTLYLLEKQKQLKAQQDQLQAQDERLKKLEALLFKNESNK
jgi:hypothetical protein